MDIIHKIMQINEGQLSINFVKIELGHDSLRNLVSRLGAFRGLSSFRQGSK